MKKTIFSILLATASVATYAESHECLLEPNLLVNLGSPVRGIIAEIPVKRGSVIKKNQVVVKIDSRAERAALRVAQARAKFTKRRVVRNEELAADDLVSPQELDDLLTESELAQLELEQANMLVDMRTIRSPVSGVVVERMMAVGEFIENNKILKIAELDPLSVEVVLPVKLFGSISTGTPARVRTQLPIEKDYRTKVSMVDKVVDAASGTFRVRLEIPNKDLAIPSGIRCMVEFDSQ